MSFNEFETSLQNGKPIRLYQFQRGPLKWGYASTNINITHLGIVFRSVEGGIADDGIRQTGDAQADLLTLTVPANLDVAQMYRQIAPHQTVNLTIYDLHYGDTGYLVSWMGIVAGVKFTNELTATIQCQTLQATLERTGLRKTWSRTCPHQLYDQSCLVERSSFKVTGTISRIDGVTISVANAAAQINNYYAGGYIEWTSQYGLEQRGIELHQGDTLTLYCGTFGLALTQEIAIYAGCDRTFATCDSKFNNVPNYGGSPHMPGKSPFDGTPIF